MKKYKQKASSINKLRGFSLIEVMLAVLVLSIGILAVSKLQTSLLRSGADANNRSVAASIAQQKVDDLRRFIQLTAPGAWSAAIVSPDLLGFNHIASNEGGLIGPGDIPVGNQNYALSWTVDNYRFVGAGSTATPTTPALSTLKLAHVKVTWDSVGDTTNNVVSFDTALYGYNAKYTVLAGSPDSAGGGEVNLLSQADEVFDNGDGSSFGHEEIAPDISKKGNSTLTTTVSTTFQTSDRVILSRDEFRTVACLCKGGTSNPSQIYGVTSWDNVNKERTDVLETRNYNITKTVTDAGGGDQPAAECDICCKDGLGDGGDVSATEKVCRLKLLGGKLFMYDPWKVVAFNVVPESYFTEGQSIDSQGVTSTTTTELNKASYVNYIGTLVRQVLLNYTTTAELYALTTVDSTFPTTSSLFNDGSINHAVFNGSEDRQLQARVLYLDLPAQGSYEGTTYTAANIPLERVPFFELNLTLLAGWVPDINQGESGPSAPNGDTVFDGDYTDDHDRLNNACNPSASPVRNFVTNEELNQTCENEFSRGFLDTHSGDDDSVKTAIFTGNNGLVDRSINTETIAISSMDVTAP
ncbi:MAG: prepilin-type N-terminal cleavage/methylation domain-containing protein [Gammaproteobacteria bacterium]|nr:prepilin-type N-terminal cleavage/methylation domain-containing protein [Gammaproteobacteria bacterium]